MDLHIVCRLALNAFIAAMLAQTAVSASASDQGSGETGITATTGKTSEDSFAHNGAPPRAKLVEMQQQIASLLAQRKLSDAEPLMRKYVTYMEQVAPGTHELEQTYSSYADLLQRLGKTMEAQAVRRKNVWSEPVGANPAGRAMQVQNGSHSGIIGVKFVLANRNFPIINRVFIGTPAAQAGLRVDDAIIEINGKSTSGMTKEQIYDQIAGAPGTIVDLGISRDKTHSMTIRIKRMSIDSLSDPIVKRDYMLNR